MNRGHRELVGLQVTFSKVVETYNLTHYYRWQDGTVLGPILMMRSYDMGCVGDKEAILEGLLTAYAPAILSIWKIDDDAFTSAFLQLKRGRPPLDQNLQGGWKLWGEW